MNKESICLGCKNMLVDFTASCSQGISPLANREDCPKMQKHQNGKNWWEVNVCSILATNALRYLSQDSLETLAYDLISHLKHENQVKLIKHLKEDPQVYYGSIISDAIDEFYEQDLLLTQHKAIYANSTVEIAEHGEAKARVELNNCLTFSFETLPVTSSKVLKSLIYFHVKDTLSNLYKKNKS